MTKLKTPILAIESSQELCSAAIFFSENHYAEKNTLQKHVHSEKLPLFINSLVEDAKIGIKDLSCIAVSSGPGSFTGLRIGFSLAKGIACGASIPIVPVPSFYSFAFQICTFLPDGVKFVIANKVSRDELYYQKFISSSGTYRQITDVQITSNKDFPEIIEKSEMIYGNCDFEGSIKISSSSAFFTAKWAYIFGKDLLSLEYDYLEPYYLKNFNPKV